MTTTATLRFLPWMRRGLARAVTTAAVDGLPTAGAAEIVASVELDGEVIERSVKLRGPGDVVGLSTAQIARVDPTDGATDVEPNYFAAVELVAPDLPWMFTPAAAAADKLVPWLVLVVVAETDGVSMTRGGGPLPVLAIAEPADASAELPDLADAWAWAHVQAATDVGAGRPVGEAYAAEPEAFLARLLCPRRLAEKTTYLACVVPAFEAGRRAGLGLSVDDDDATLAWSSGTTAIELPVYHSWRFTTGPDGDFEALVRRLVPREVDAGVHDLDIGEPGGTRLPSAPGTLVSFEGALVSPAVTRRAWDADHRDAFQAAMGALLDESLTASSAPRPYDPLRDDPVVAPPAYGALPAGADAIPAPLAEGAAAAAANEPVWLADVNLDPVTRSAAGLGATVVRRNQESLMASAWAQAESLRDINRVLQWTRLAAEVGGAIATRKIAPMDDGALIQLAGTARGRVAAGAGRTVRGQLAAAAVPTGVISAAFRRVARRGGTVGRGLAGAEATRVTAAKVARTFTTDLAEAMAFASYVRPIGVQAGDASIIAAAPGMGEDGARETARARAARPRGRGRRRSAARPATTAVADAIARDVVVRDVIDVVLPATTVSVVDVAGALRAGLDPGATLAAKLRGRISAPAAAWGTALVPALMTAEPAFPDPMSELLRRVDPELLLPGAGEIPDDTVGLVEVNARFVEAFLLGANHELAREFVWREYPVDLTGTWLRTFWDSIDGAIEDIGAVDGWSADRLGTHQTGVAADGSLVLLIKGALLRRYPDTVIYAVRAAWNSDRTAREEAVGGERREPLFSGRLGDGLSFLGFELTVADARGKVGRDGEPVPGGDPGWFFVFEEPPVGPRFGLDVGDDGDAGTSPARWKNVSWLHQVDTAAALADLTHARATGRLLGVRRGYEEDAFFETWGLSAAAMARITFQRPVRMLVHASAMLP